jgi:cold shock CspA family protein
VVLPRVSSRGEEPGTIRLHEPAQRGETDKGAPLESVELWARCLSEGMSGMLRVGDELRLDVTNYRPEKLIFARNVSIEKFFSVGRCFGTVCDVKEARGFGFIRSSMGDVDAYFRIAEVVGADGLALKEQTVVIGLHVSYDVTIEEVSE